MSEFFPRVRFYQSGYNPAEVDQFFVDARDAYEGGVPASQFSSEHVHQAMFSLSRHGYDPATVDAALDRLESAFVNRDRADHVAVNGEEAWLDHIADRATTLYPRLIRPVGERFAHPPRRRLGYKASEVDEFMDHLGQFFDDQETLRAEQVRSLAFSPAKGRRAYHEGIVDAYLGRVIEILLAVE